MTNRVRPQTHRGWSHIARESDFSTNRSFTPPQENYNDFSPEDYYEKVMMQVEEAKVEEFTAAHDAEIHLSYGYLTHPSRELDNWIEGALFREYQDKITETLRFKIAEELVAQRVWPDIGSAFAERERIKKAYFNS